MEISSGDIACHLPDEQWRYRAFILPQGIAGIIGLIRSFVARRDMQAAEAEAWEAELRELGARDEYFFSLGRFVFLARRPLA